MGILVSEQYDIEQTYLWNTNILSTTFTSDEGSFQVIDFMPRYEQNNGSYHCPPDIVRFIRLIDGKPRFKVHYDPKLQYARHQTRCEIRPDFIKHMTTAGKYDSLYLYSDIDLNLIMDSENTITLSRNAFFYISYHEKTEPVSQDSVYLEFQRTKTYWMNWADHTTKYPVYQEEIMRSALALKALTYDPTGAVLAAATTSLPESIGEVRNWDYRFCWIRDASMVIQVLTQLGHDLSAAKFLDFVISLVPGKNEKMQIMYGIHGEKDLEEKILDHLAGYENSAPVRIGNGAYTQKQHDIYGILMEVVWQEITKFKIDTTTREALWSLTKNITRIVDEHWQEPDKGIWEFRTSERHFTFSKLLSWVAIDRAVQIGERLGKQEYLRDWKSLRAQIREAIETHCWNEKVGAYTQSYGSEDLDASTLLMEQYGFCHATDKRYRATVRATERELCKDGLLYRYKNKDDFGLPTSSFTICTFWFIYSLARIGEREKAREYFEQVLGYSNHLGLFSEDIDFKTKRLLGNFPQAYSHLALIQCAIELGTQSK
jgi:GH15 family glucan-1,4-alpha-glucosidase